MAIFTSRLADEPQEYLPTGVTPFHVTVGIPTTALDGGSDNVLLYQFPTSPFDGEVWLERCILDFDDLDSNVTPTLTVNVGIGDVDGAIDFTLLSGSLAGRTGATVVARDYANLPVEVSGKYLILAVTIASATPAAGNIDIFGAFAAGVLSKTAAAVLA